MPVMPKFDFAVLLVILLASAFSIYCRYRNEPLYKVAKPIPLLLLIGFYLLHLGQASRSSWFSVALLLGLIGGLAGDILLLFPERFLAGLAAFLAGHVFYILGFAAGDLRFSPPVLVATPIATFCFAGLLLREMEPSRRRKYLVPILVYVLAITLLFLTAFGYDIRHRSLPPLFAIGALLFCLSDGVLAWNRFARPFHAAQFVILTTYYSAQILITFKAIWLISRPAG